YWPSFRERFAAQLCQVRSESRVALFRERLDSLTEREWEVLLHILQGSSCKETAVVLGVAIATAPRLRVRVFEKLGTRNPVELAQLVSELCAPNRVTAARIMSD
ncbi:MAG TPA: LuxR C-terminal-related transcriptional regulator, partial [Planctomycetaceae bacterium]|nr:LuxR C-terminal-related transcriptional regulator [Planctomycetaceae bacterium]